MSKRTIRNAKRTKRNARRQQLRRAPGPEVWGDGEFTFVVLHEGQQCPLCDAFGGPPLAHSLVAGWESTQNGEGPALTGQPFNAVPLHRSSNVNAT